jgi:hypothetical protein
MHCPFIFYLETVCAGESIQGLALYTETLNLIMSCHFRQLTRSKHEAHGGEDIHLATAMDP